MAKQTINLGHPNGKDGDLIRDAFSKVNDNFTDLYNFSDAFSSLTPATVAGGATSVVYSFPNRYTSAKLVIQVEGRIDGDGTNTDQTQTCEATIAASYNGTAEPVISVYGVVYTTVTPLATFTVRRGAGVNAGNIEILAANSQATNDLVVKVQSLQFVSRYD